MKSQVSTKEISFTMEMLYNVYYDEVNKEVNFCHILNQYFRKCRRRLRLLKKKTTKLYLDFTNLIQSVNRRVFISIVLLDILTSHVDFYTDPISHTGYEFEKINSKIKLNPESENLQKLCINFIVKLSKQLRNRMCFQ